VLLTRTADKDFTTAADSSLRGDLNARTFKANAFDADVFLSIHHNADAGSRHDLNETQTYYKFSDPYASYDLGQAIHRHLALNLAIGADRLLPGNYAVVRNSAFPAVLGESSYLTNPEVESRLALAAKQRLEAEAYFLGLVDYFRTGVPRITATRVEPAAGDPLDGSERPWLVAVSDRAPTSARLVLDGVAVDTLGIERTSTGARYRPAAPLTDGRHRVEWMVRAGNWSRARRDSFEVDLPVARTVLSVEPAGLAPGQVAGLTLRALDRHDRAVADTVAARFVARVGGVVVDSLGHASAPGEARAYARITGGSAAEFAAQVTRPRVRAELAEPSARLTLAPPSGTSRATSGFVRTREGAPVAGARVVIDTVATTTNGDGFFALRVSGQPTAEAPGYLTSSASTAAQLRLVPIGGGALLGRRIAIDAADFDSIDANLPVALAVTADLEAAGARVVLTRMTPDSMTAIDRLRVTEAFAAERVVSISHRGGAATAGHYFSSPGGKALAGRIARRLGGKVVESPSYLVQQTAAVAVAVNLAGAAPEAEAYALYLALLEDFGGADTGKLPVTVMRAGAPAANVPVTLDGRWRLLTGPDGTATFDALPAGVVLTLESGGVVQRVTLPAPGVTLTLP
jgi:N-acetylmuramoyl-L-alanine amidase